MKKFLIVLEYELKEYFKSKGFVALTLIIAVLGAIALCLPRFIDMSDFTGVQVKAEVEEKKEDSVKEDDMQKMYILDEAGVADMTVLQSIFTETEWVTAENVEAVKMAVEEQEAEAGFVVKSASEYDYYVFNREMTDVNSMMFDEAMKVFNRMQYCTENNLDYTEITGMYEAPITVNAQILNKDSGSNYWYCYFLIMIVYMLIIFYGQMIAVSVTNEKSNRAIEVLVTSTTPNSILFGKVIAGAIGGLCQVGIMFGAILISYEMNRDVWGGMLDMFLHIPVSVLVTFAMFGVGGYLFYAFLYGAMGALVSKTEDVSKSSSGLMIIIMAVFFFSLTQLMNVDGAIIKVLSFLPISSYSTMFVRIAMGTIQTWEIVVSFLILVASIIGTGFIGAKLYRMGTLRYGNPIKLSAALKAIRKAE
ncbi:MAG: ABC transporter permease [Lachnospiraceae bacterium]|nr:ABC transporter permease [Lachnospiraceae bacterium]